MTPSISIRLFGPPDVRVGEAPLPRLKTRKGLWLLALLVLRHDRQVVREWLAGTLWPEAEESNALCYLRQALTDLRHALGPEARRLRSASARTLCLDCSGASVDVIDFEQGVARGDTESLERAVSAYRGPLLEGCTEEWVLQEREACEQAYLGAQERLAQEFLAAGSAEKAVRCLRLVVAADPLRESAARLLMESLARCGDFAAVTEAYRELRQRLYREVNVEPQRETQELFRGLREEARQRAGANRGGASPLAPAGPTPAAPAAPAPARGRLPRPLSGFVGRDEEVAETARCLLDCRLVTLTGIGGVGKTRLAIQAAREAEGDFPDGAWFVDLAPLSDPELVAEAVATVLDVVEPRGGSILDALRQHLEDRRALLVLDNCEHVLLSCAGVAAFLLEGCPQLHVLATSRQRLGILGEVERRVPPLSLPELGSVPQSGDDLVSILRGSEAVRLFLDRAQRVRSDLPLDTPTLKAVARVCCRLDGIPLALELAAARMSALGPDQLAARLEEQFSLLVGDRTAHPRQQTLRALLDWSYDLLSEEEKALLRRLSVFAGGWSLEAAERVCSRRGVEATRTAGCLAGLVDRSLVVAEPEEGGFRYRLLETVRHYAHEKLVRSGEEAELRRRHRDCFMDLAKEAHSKLYGSEQKAWLERLESEHDNLRLALAWSLEEPEGGDAALRLSRNLQSFWSMRGYFSEGREHLRAAIARAGPAGSREVRASALNAAGNLAKEQGDYAEALSLFQQALAIRREMRDERGIDGILNSMGLAAEDQGDAAAGAG